MKVLICILFVCFLYIDGNSQLLSENKIEIEIKGRFPHGHVYEFGKDGVILLSKTDSKWGYTLFNQDLESVEYKSMDTPKKQFFEESFSTKDRLFSLFKDHKKNFTLFSTSVNKIEIKKVEGTLPFKADFNYLCVLGDFAYIDFRGKNDFWLCINWKTGEQKILSFFNEEKYKAKQLESIDVQVSEKSNELFFFCKYLNENKKIDLYAFIYNEKGEQVKRVDLFKDSEMDFGNITTTSMGEGVFTFSGSYSKNIKSDYEGLFFSTMKDNSQEFIKFYKFSELENFYSHLSKEEMDKIKSKIEDREKKDKNFKSDDIIITHELITVKNDYIIIAEICHPTYRSESYTTYINGSAQTRTRVVFAGNEYTHAAILKIDSHGNLIWDQNFEMLPSYKPYSLKKLISVLNSDDSELKLVFSDNNHFVTKIINQEGEVIQDKKSEKIKTKYTFDDIEKISSEIMYWYDNYFISYGTYDAIDPKIKNKKEKLKKMVFISKVKFAE